MIEKRKTAVANGVALHYINDLKYKTNYLNIYFSLPLTSENTTKMSLLAKVIKRGSKTFPTMASLNSALDMNYSSSITLSSSKEGETAVFMMGISTLKNDFALEGEDIFVKALDIAFDLLMNPLTEEGKFKEEYFESEKKNLRDSILSQINNKAAYARMRFISAMCQGEPFAVNGEGDLEVLEKTDNASLFDFWKYLLKSAECHVYFVGNEKEERIKELLRSRFEKTLRLPVSIPETQIIFKENNKDVTEELDIAQAHLFVGFRTPVTYSHPDYLKFVLLNMVLGGDVSSKMFMNLREKMSLCYTCYSSLDGSKGILSAYAGIDPENKEKTLDAFYKELDNIKEGKVSAEELEDAKKAYVNRMREIADNPSLLPAWFHLRLNAEGRDPALDAEEIKKLTLDDVISAAKNIKLDTVYFLTKVNEKLEMRN
ncbi:MAG: insulinase family protein [Clostridia bacterium]|nr:insulinase family protein [Clostridia bacterium]